MINLSNYFLSSYDNNSYLVRRKASNILYCSMIYAIMLLIGLCIHIFFAGNGTVFQIGDIVAFILNIAALTALRQNKLTIASNLLYLSICLLLIIHNIIGDYIAAEPLTHFRVLQTTVTFFLMYFIISLTATKLYQSLLFVGLSLFIIAMHSYELVSRFYKFNPDSDVVSHLVSYFILAVFGGLLCFLVLKINNEAITFLGKKNEELEIIIEDRAKKAARLFEEREAFYKRTLESEAIIQGFIENADDIFFTLDLNGIYSFISPQVEKITGYGEKEFLGKYYYDVFQSDYSALDIDAVTKTKVEMESHFVNGFGQVQWFSVHSSPVRASGIEYVIGVARDITEKKRLEQTLLKYATTDDMTGAKNRYAGLQALSELLTNKTAMTVCYIDLDDLKPINDQFGHQEGDYFITTVAQNILQEIEENDILCRIGGDEFILILPGRSKAAASSMFDKIMHNLTDINTLKLKPYRMSFSYGCEEIIDDTQLSLDSLIKCIDNKMYLQKSVHKTVQ